MSLRADPSLKSTGCLCYELPRPGKIDTGIAGIKIDFNSGVRVFIPAGVTGVFVQMTDLDTQIDLLAKECSGERIITAPVKYYVNWAVRIVHNGKVFIHNLTLKDEKVCFRMEDGVIGDTLAWIPYVDEFCKIHGCRGTVIGTNPCTDLLAYNFPNLTFARDVTPTDFYATYHLGVFRPYDQNVIHQPYDPRRFGLAMAAGHILGIDRKIDLKLDVDPCDDDVEIEGKYVCIATQSTGMRKYWNNPFGWYNVVKYLKSIGYKVVCIDRDPVGGINEHPYIMPPGCEDFTGNIPIVNRAAMIKHCDFFIGLSSGLSWLAWGLGKPVVLISGFTWDFNEFDTPYRVQNKSTCTGCWHWSNDVEYDACPKFDQAESEEEREMNRHQCTRRITPVMVTDAIKRLIKDHHL